MRDHYAHALEAARRGDWSQADRLELDHQNLFNNDVAATQLGLEKAKAVQIIRGVSGAGSVVVAWIEVTSAPCGFCSAHGELIVYGHNNASREIVCPECNGDKETERVTGSPRYFTDCDGTPLPTEAQESVNRMELLRLCALNPNQTSLPLLCE